MLKTFEEDESLVKLANKIITEQKLDYLNSVVIKYVFVSPFISKTVPARCIKANSELKFFGQFDFLIEISRDIWDSIDDPTREILMHHELLHPLIKTTKKGMVPALAGHDLQDFYTIIKKHGPDWFREFKDVVAATYEMQGAEKDKITV